LKQKIRWLKVNYIAVFFTGDTKDGAILHQEVYEYMSFKGQSRRTYQARSIGYAHKTSLHFFKLEQTDYLQDKDCLSLFNYSIAYEDT
jgi:hypothetical protein